jgi:hypothetical protein
MDEHLEASYKAAKENNLRQAYSHGFQVLQPMLREKRFADADAVISHVCDNDFSVEYAIGMIRFASAARRHLPSWDMCLHKLRVKAIEREFNVKRLMRGLIHD